MASTKGNSGVESAANRRSMSRHGGAKDTEASGLFPGPNSSEVLDRAGIHSGGYITKKGTPYGVDAMFNTLPPGMEIEDQEHSDIRSMPYKEVTGKSYPGDGWK